MTGGFELRHLRTLVTRFGIIEHARGAEPRLEAGICLDDVARLLVFASRESQLLRSTGGGFDDGTLIDWIGVALDFMELAHLGSGRFLDRRTVDGQWSSAVAGDDACGRALWGLGEAVADLADVRIADRARRLFESASTFRSIHPRSSAFSVRGAASILARDPGHRPSRGIITDVSRSFRDLIDHVGSRAGTDWMWPDRGLTYANAVIPEMILMVGREQADPETIEIGLSLLEWLVDLETHELGHLSPTPTSGRTRQQRAPGFDQQPIEVSTLADACATALAITGVESWSWNIDRCIGWFEGRNDNGLPMIDENTGGGYDGLTGDGVNLNQGAESTLAMLTTLQHRDLAHPAGSPRGRGEFGTR